MIGISYLVTPPTPLLAGITLRLCVSFRPVSFFPSGICFEQSTDRSANRYLLSMSRSNQFIRFWSLRMAELYQRPTHPDLILHALGLQDHTTEFDLSKIKADPDKRAVVVRNEVSRGTLCCR